MSKERVQSYKIVQSVLSRSEVGKTEGTQINLNSHS